MRRREAEPVERTADEALGRDGNKQQTAKADAVEFLSNVLAEGPAKAKDIEKEARAACLLGEAQLTGPSKPFRSARRDFGVTSHQPKGEKAGGWFWALPEDQMPPDAGETDLLVKYLAGGGDCCCCSIRSSRSVRICRSTCSAPSGSAPSPPTDRSAQSLPHRSHKAAVPYYPPHPITERLAPPPEGVRTVLLAASSQDSYRRPAAAGRTALASAEQATPDAEDGRWRSRSKGCSRGAPSDKHFRLVVAGTSKFASGQ